MTDEEQIRLLRWAFEDEAPSPPATSIAALHLAVRNTFNRRKRRRSWKIGSLVAASIATSALTGSSVAFAVDGIPHSLRAVMHGMGLPVDSIALANAKSIEGHLAVALRQHNLRVAKRDAHRLAHRLRMLNSNDRARVEQQATALLTQTHSLGVSDGGHCVAAGTPGTQGPGGPDRNGRSSATTLPASPVTVINIAVPAEDILRTSTRPSDLAAPPSSPESKDSTSDATDGEGEQRSPSTANLVSNSNPEGPYGTPGAESQSPATPGEN
jgi:hypothetical protein